MLLIIDFDTTRKKFLKDPFLSPCLHLVFYYIVFAHRCAKFIFSFQEITLKTEVLFWREGKKTLFFVLYIFEIQQKKTPQGCGSKKHFIN
jgi:hypothetical protein